METIKILVSGNFLCNNALLACSIKQYEDILKKKKKKEKSQFPSLPKRKGKTQQCKIPCEKYPMPVTSITPNPHKGFYNPPSPLRGKRARRALLERGRCFLTLVGEKKQHDGVNRV